MFLGLFSSSHAGANDWLGIVPLDLRAMATAPLEFRRRVASQASLPFKEADIVGLKRQIEIEMTFQVKELISPKLKMNQAF